MENPLKVSLENIIPLTEARDHFSQIVSEVQKDKLYVLTKGGKPAVAIIDVKYLEHITGGEAKVENIEEEIKKAPEKVGLAPMVEHKEEMKVTPPPPPPAGFAAPQPKADRPLAEKPEPPSAPPQPKPAPPPPPPTHDASQLKTPPLSEEKPASPPSGIPGRVDVEFSPDETTLEKKAQDGQIPENKKVSPDDKNPPAQYAGEKDNPPAGGAPEPEDMAID